MRLACYPSAAHVLMPLGDSITNGEGVDPSQAGYRTALFNQFQLITTVGSQSGRPPVPPAPARYGQHEGHDGFSSLQLLNLINGVSQDYVRTYMPDTMLILCGANDLAAGLTPTQSVNNQLAMITAARSIVPGMRFFFMMPTNASSDPSENGRNAYMDAMRPIMTSNLTGIGGVYLVTNPTLINPGDFSDTVHPSTSGYTKITNAFISAMAAAGGY